MTGDDARHGARGRWVGWAVAVVVMVLAVLSLDPARVGLSMYQPIAQVIAMRGLLAICLLIAAAALLFCALLIWHRGESRPTRLAITSAVLVAVAITHSGVVLSRGTSTPVALPEHKPDGAIDVLAFNTLGNATSERDVATLIDDYDPDVVALPETTATSAHAIANRTAGQYSVFIGQGTSHVSAPTVLLVAASLGPYERIDGPNIAYGMVGAKPANGVGPVVYAVHAVSPLGDRLPTWRSELALLTDLCDDTDGAIVAGDFNATLDHEALRATRCIDGSVDSGGIGTWPSAVASFLSAPIDHVLVDPSAWTPIASTATERPHSDHRAIVVRLVLAT